MISFYHRIQTTEFVKQEGWHPILIALEAKSRRKETVNKFRNMRNKLMPNMGLRFGVETAAGVD